MPRSKGQDGQALRQREDLEAALGALADHAECSPLVRLRIEQAIRRAGLGSLLGPALDELDRMSADVADARAQILSAVEKVNG